MAGKQQHKLVLVGWDAADWNIIEPLLLAGKMPHLKKMMENGAHGAIATMDPPLSPMLWTSIATGKTADQHGILGFVEPDSNTGKVRPASSTSRNCKAIWNILNQQGHPANVIGWWPSHPAEPIDGVMVSNMFGKSPDGKYFEGSVHPVSLAAELMQCKVEAKDITLEQLLPFVPAAATVDQEKDKHLHNLAALLANFLTIGKLGKYVLKKYPAVFTGIYFDVIDQLCHTFMKFYPPQMEGVPDDFFKLYQQVIPQMYIQHDQLLGELMDIAGSDTCFAVLSDHGFYSDHLRPVRLPNDPASPALEHALFGMFCIQGPGIKKATGLEGIGLLDIAPTILSYLGIAPAADMPGKVMSAAFSSKVNEQRIASWESVDGNCGMHPRGLTENSWYSTEAMFQMMELGYIERMEADQELILRKVLNESNYYLSRVYFSREQIAAAEELLAALYQSDSSTYRYGINYAASLQRLGKRVEARSVVHDLKKRFPREITAPELLEALLLEGEGAIDAALDTLLSLLERVQHLPQLFVFIGNLYCRREEYFKAIAMYEGALALDKQHVPALQGICFASEKGRFLYAEHLVQLQRLSDRLEPELQNSLYKVNELDLNPDRKLDFRKYQLIIRLFLEQFHKGIEAIR